MLNMQKESSSLSRFEIGIICLYTKQKIIYLGVSPFEILPDFRRVFMKMFGKFSEQKKYFMIVEDQKSNEHKDLEKKKKYALSVKMDH